MSVNSGHMVHRQTTSISGNRLSRQWGGRYMRRLIRKNLWFYVLTNLVFNALVPYVNFEDTSAVYLFKGTHCFARYLLPMALLLPFILSIDILKKTIALIEGGNTGVLLPQPFAKYRFIFKTAIYHALLAILPIATVLWCLPANRTYDGSILAVVAGLLAGIMAGFFALRSVGELKKLTGNCR